MGRPYRGASFASEAGASPGGPSTAAVNPQRLELTWESSPDAGTSTCVSGSEGSIPLNSQEQQLLQQQQMQRVRHPQVQQVKQQGEVPPLRRHELGSDSLCSGSYTLSHSDALQQEEQRQQDQQQQQQHSLPDSNLRLLAAAVPEVTLPHSGGSSESGVSSLPVAVHSASAASAASVAGGLRGSSSYSACTTSSLGIELRSLINALAAADNTAEGDEVQRVLQGLLAERDLYKSAFRAAKEELKDQECRHHQLMRALQHSEQEQLHACIERQHIQLGPQKQLQLEAGAANAEFGGADIAGATHNVSQLSDASGAYPSLQQLQACVTGGNYPQLYLLQRSAEEVQQLMRQKEELQQERESYVEAVACLHSQLREAHEDHSLCMSAHATHAADLTAESDEALRAADLWLQQALRTGTKCKFWGMGSVVHNREAAAASVAQICSTGVALACGNINARCATTAGAVAAVVAAEDPPPGVSVALAAAASVFAVQDDFAMGDDAGSSRTATGPATAELERLWWGQRSDAFVERQQLQQKQKQRERDSRLLWFLE